MGNYGDYKNLLDVYLAQEGNVFGNCYGLNYVHP